jgi:hypothetical protein
LGGDGAIQAISLQKVMRIIVIFLFKLFFESLIPYISSNYCFILVAGTNISSHAPINLCDTPFLEAFSVLRPNGTYSPRPCVIGFFQLWIIFDASAMATAMARFVQMSFFVEYYSMAS